MKFWQKNLYSLWFAQFIAALGLNLVGPFLPFYLRDLGIEDDKSLKIWSGVAYAAPFVVSAFMQPLWGILGDRLGRKPMIVRAMLGLSLANILMGFAQSAPQFVFFRLFQGFLSGFIAPSLALMASSTPAEKIGYALGTLQTALISSLIMGPMIGGVFMHLTGLRPIFFATGFLCLAGAIIVSLYVREEFAPVNGSGKVQLKNNFYHIFRSSELRSMFFLLVLVQFSIFFWRPLSVCMLNISRCKSSMSALLPALFLASPGLLARFPPPSGEKDRT